MKKDANSTAPLRFGWILSVLFWLALLFAAGLYGVVALSPKVVAWLQHRDKWESNQETLVQMERKVHYLQRVALALENDPEFKAELARIELNASRPGEQHISVQRDLTMQALREVPPVREESEPPWQRFAIEQCAANEPLRRAMLIFAVLTVLLAFTYLHESQIVRIKRTVGVVSSSCRGVRSGCRWVKKRYGKSRFTGNGPWGVG